MRIISNFKDYYDFAGTQDKDDIVYLRKQETFTFDFRKDLKAHTLHRSLIEPFRKLPKTDSSVRFPIRLFSVCGKLYYVYGVPGKYYQWSYTNKIEVVEIAAKEYYERQYKNRRGAYPSEWKETKPHRWLEDLPFSPWGFNTWNKQYGRDVYSVSVDLHRHYSAPVLLINGNPNVGNDITVNPFLKEYDFQSIIDPYTIAQEIDMYLGNELAVQKDPPAPITDKLRAEYHGFDEHSFRKLPTKRK